MSEALRWKQTPFFRLCTKLLLLLLLSHHSFGKKAVQQNKVHTKLHTFSHMFQLMPVTSQKNPVVKLFHLMVWDCSDLAGC